MKVGVAAGVAALSVVLAVPLAAVVVESGVVAAVLGSDGPCVAAPALAGDAGFTAEQITIARDAVAVANQRHLAQKAKLIILATGFQESGVRNLEYGDRDSVGWLQQRAGWGTVQQRLNPTYAAGKFFDALVKVPNWESLPVTVAAQAVQISGYPDAYARWVPQAQTLLAKVGEPAAKCAGPANSDTGGGAVPASFDKQGNPRTAAEATSWMVAQVKNRTTPEPVEGACERWMNLAYGRAGGYPTAISHWNAAGAKSTSESPPRGALIYIWSPNPARHVALSLGNGQAVSTDYDGHGYASGRLGIGSVASIEAAFGGHLLGWRAPNFDVGSGR